MALIAAAIRQLLWGSRAVSREIQHWRSRAGAIPDPCLRKDAHSLDRKRSSAHGAGLFWILTKQPNQRLLRLLVSYEVMADFLDSTNERGASAGRVNGCHLHLALIDALNPDRRISDYYLYHSWREDGGYLQALIKACHSGCASLHSYTRVRSLTTQAATNAQILGVNHEVDWAQRDIALKDWAERKFSDEYLLSWFELSAAASAWLTILALLALAAEPICRERDVLEVYAAYFPWISMIGTMLDSYVDQEEDTANGDHSYVAHYPTPDIAAQRIRELIQRSTHRARALPNGAGHPIIVACMIAMYLSKNSAGTPAMRPTTRSFIQAGGPLVRVLIPILRGWRRAYDPSLRVEPLRPIGPCSHSIVQTLAFARRPLGYLDQCSSRYGPRFTLRPLSFPPLVFLSDPSDIRALLKAPSDVLHPGEGGTVIEPLVGSSSFMLLDEEEHLNGRKTILPAFPRNTVLQSAEMMSKDLTREVASWPLDRPVALHPRLRALTLQIVLHKIFTPTEPTANAHISALHERLLAMLSVTASAVLSEPMLRYGPGFRIWRRFLRERTETDETILALIDERTKTAGGQGDVLDMLLKARNTDGTPMSQQQIRDNLMSVVLAGHETTSSQLAWAFQLLAHHPHVQARLAEEIDRGESREYLTATIHEVLRHRPVFLFAIPRAVVRPFQLGGFTYHPPTRLLACIYLVHHDPDIYPQPHEFRPERFLHAPPGTPAWLPWGGGRKRCPGLHLATLEMQSVLEAVLSEVTVHPAGRRMEHPRWRSVIVTPHAGSRVILRPRAPRRRRALLDQRPASGAESLHRANPQDRQAIPLSEHF